MHSELLPSTDLAPVQKRLRTFSAQFHDFRPVRAQIAIGLTTDASHHGAIQIDTFSDENRTSMNLKCTNRGHNREEDKMHKRYEEEQWRIEHADNATITFTIALRGPHAWDMQMEDSHRYHSISHGWATENPHDWENTILPVLRQLFVNS
jgi:hypothetical protein